MRIHLTGNGLSSRRQFFRRVFSRLRLFSILFTVLTGAQVAKLYGQFGQPRRYRDGIQVNFKQQLEQGLYARRPEEFEFIARVVRMVDENQLPRQLVESTFQWARKKRPYPYVYFERGLKVRAARLRITVR